VDYVLHISTTSYTIPTERMNPIQTDRIATLHTTTGTDITVTTIIVITITTSIHIPCTLTITPTYTSLHTLLLTRTLHGLQRLEQLILLVLASVLSSVLVHAQGLAGRVQCAVAQALQLRTHRRILVLQYAIYILYKK